MGHAMSTHAPAELLDELFGRLLAAGGRLLRIAGWSRLDQLLHGDFVAYRDLVPADHDEQDALLVELLSYSDYGGSDLDAANVEALEDMFTPYAFVHLYGPHGSVGLAVPFGRPLPEDPGCEQLSRLVATVEGLLDCPLVDEETHSRYVEELADAAWSQWLSFDVVRELEDYAPDDAASDALFDCGGETLRDAYYGYEGNEWQCETATSVTNLRHDEAVRHVAACVFGWSA